MHTLHLLIYGAAGVVAGAGVGFPQVVAAVGLRPEAMLMVVLVLGLPLRRHRHGHQATTDLGACWTVAEVVPSFLPSYLTQSLTIPAAGDRGR
jgi:hypothetical protein